MAKYFMVLLAILVVCVHVDAQIFKSVRKKLANLKKALDRPMSFLRFKAEMARTHKLSIKDLNFKEVRSFFQKTPPDSFKNARQRTIVSNNFLSAICSLCQQTNNARCIRIYCFRG